MKNLLFCLCIFLTSCTRSSLDLGRVDASLGSVESSKSMLKNDRRKKIIEEPTKVLLNDKEISFKDFEKIDGTTLTSLSIEKDFEEIHKLGYDTLEIKRVFVLKD